MGKLRAKPPPEKMMLSHATSASKTELPWAIWVAPTEVMVGHVPGKDGLKFPLSPSLYWPVAGSMHVPPLPATP